MDPVRKAMKTRSPMATGGTAGAAEIATNHCGTMGTDCDGVTGAGVWLASDVGNAKETMSSATLGAMNLQYVVVRPRGTPYNSVIESEWEAIGRSRDRLIGPSGNRAIGVMLGKAPDRR